MARMNNAVKNTNVTHEGAPALPTMSPMRELRRAVSSCLLWEDGFYEDGASIGQRLRDLVGKCPTQYVLDLAVEVRTEMNLRHAPLWLIACAMGPEHQIVPGAAEKIASVLKRADDPGELLALFGKAWPDAKRGETGVKVPAAIKRGIGLALHRYDAYQLAKYDRAAQFKLRDLLRISHPKPLDETQAENWRKLLAGELAAPDTWEVALSGGADKRETFERLLREGNLGYMALLRNLRNMVEAGVDRTLIESALAAGKGARNVLPFRYTAAARAAPSLEPAIDAALVARIGMLPKFSGRTALLVDVSGSMASPLSAKSDLTRMDAAATLASIFPGERRVFTFSNNLVEVPARHGMSGVDVIRGSQPHGMTDLRGALRVMNDLRRADPYERLVVITDEESQTVVGNSEAPLSYMINVAQARHAVGYGRWVRIEGFSENVLRFMTEHESLSSRPVAMHPAHGTAYGAAD